MFPPPRGERTLPLDEEEKEYILKILDKTGRNKYQTAHALGIDRKTLYRNLAEIEGKAQPGSDHIELIV